MDYNDKYTEFLNLYKLSEQPFSPRKSYSACKEFKNSFERIEKEFIPTELKQWQAHLGSNQERRNQNPL